ncbi:Cleavage induced protein [Phytophthora megakarya]|uniref:Cleavage induced protein n=1 Tax=Phytophthora megakarya TaxID=4795 RepID=A0A225VGH1_9STRA|nr:Cleavage induced protein [Phytophthora megakarya]
MGEVDLTVDALGELVNDNTKSNLGVDVSYDGADARSNRALDVVKIFPTLQHMMTGDVNGASRNIPISVDHVGRFAETIPELEILVIGLILHPPTGLRVLKSVIFTPIPLRNGRYNLFLLMKSLTQKPGISIEADIGSRLAGADISLRYSLVSVSGPKACNEKTFSGWFTCGRALRLDWDLEALNVSLPAAKVSKALSRILAMSKRPTATRTHLQKRLASLRHIVTCIRPAAPFFQRVAAVARVTKYAKDNLHCFTIILAIGRLHRIPLSRFICLHEPDIYIHMNASDRGLCALFSACHQYLQVEFSDTERAMIDQGNAETNVEFCINVRVVKCDRNLTR